MVLWYNVMSKYIWHYGTMSCPSIHMVLWYNVMSKNIWHYGIELFGPVAPGFKALFPATVFRSTLSTSDWTPWREGNGLGLSEFSLCMFLIV